MAARADLPSGVPQRPARRPRLFHIFMNDLAKVICKPCCLLAGDVTVACVHLEQDIKKVKSRVRFRDLSLNQVSKAYFCGTAQME